MSARIRLDGDTPRALRGLLDPRQQRVGHAQAHDLAHRVRRRLVRRLDDLDALEADPELLHLGGCDAREPWRLCASSCSS